MLKHGHVIYDKQFVRKINLSTKAYNKEALSATLGGHVV